MFKVCKRALASFLCASLAVCALAGCSKKVEEEPSTDWSVTAMTLGDDTISAGEMNFLLRYQESQSDQFIQMFYEMGYGNMWENGNGDMLKDSTVSTLHNMLQAKQHMADYGVELTDDDKAKISEAADAFIAANSQETLDKMTATKENVEKILTLYMIQHRMETEMTADVNTEVSDEEAAQRTVRYVSFTPHIPEEGEAETETLMEDMSEAAAEVAEEAELATEDAAKTGSADESEGAPQEAETQADAEPATEAVETEAETETPEMAAAKDIAWADASAFLESVKGVSDAQAFSDAGNALEGLESDTAVSSWSFGTEDETPAAAIIAATDGLADNTLVESVIEADDVYYVLFVEYEFDRAATDAKKDEIVQNRKDLRIEELYSEWETEDGFTTNSAALDLMVFDMFLLPPETEPQSEALSEAEAETEAATEATTEATTEAPAETEAETAAATEAQTEAATEVQTEAATEGATE